MQAYDQDNVFAKMLRGEVPCHRVYEDEHCLAFLDIAPQSKGHTLVIPKFPCRNLLDCDDKALAGVALAVKKVAHALKTSLQADGITVIQRNESAANQVVFHLHFNVLPRYLGKALGAEGEGETDHGALADLASTIRAAF